MEEVASQSSEVGAEIEIYPSGLDLRVEEFLRDPFNYVRLMSEKTGLTEASILDQLRQLGARV